MPTVLFVDDEKPLLIAITRVLRNEPYAVITTTSAKEAMALVNTQKIDIVVSDERMPEISGAALLEQIHKDHPDIVCIMLTGEPSLTIQSQIIENGHLYRFLSKPVDNDELRRVLKQALHMRETISMRPTPRKTKV